jgi:cholesterol oxidase
MSAARDQYDVVIIGSGFGGAVTSCRLSEAGLKVLVLERGRRWDTETFPRSPGAPWIWDQTRPAKRNGWLDFRVHRGASVALGAGVGGGSLIYANVVIDADPALFERDWPPEITFAELTPYYARVQHMLNPQPVPENQVPERFKLIEESARRLGYTERFRRLPLAITFDPAWHYGLERPLESTHSKSWTNAQGKSQGTCVHCGNCYIGCPVSARNTLDLNYLARAEALGATVRPLHLVQAISPVAGGYRVDYSEIRQGELRAGHVTAPRVIVAAGSLGSSELLLRCRDQLRTLPRLSPMLGHSWSANGDFMTVSVHDRSIRPTHGPTITAAVDFLDGSEAGHRFFVEDGGFPAIFGDWMAAKRPFDWRNPGFSSMIGGLAFFLRRYGDMDKMMPWFAQSHDASDGELYLGRVLTRPWKTRLKIRWNSAESRATIDAVYAMHRRFAEATGGKIATPFVWTLLKSLITPHPLGGCRMGRRPDDGVVDHRGEAFHYPGLFVADGSVVPKAIGLNPSKTIAALAERTAALMA